MTSVFHNKCTLILMRRVAFFCYCFLKLVSNYSGKFKNKCQPKFQTHGLSKKLALISRDNCCETLYNVFKIELKFPTYYILYNLHSFRCAQFTKCINIKLA